MSRRSRIHRSASWLGVALLLGSGCERATVESPFEPLPVRDAGRRPPRDAATEYDWLITDDEAPTGAPRDPTLGGRCLDQRQCDDGIECTFDSCDQDLQRCRFSPDSSRCQDDLYCNGQEVCVPGSGCGPGEPVSCDDGSACTIDRCVEETRDCERRDRDVDGDGDPDAHCLAEGGDCDDRDVTVSSKQIEICGNGKDDNCDRMIDEAQCRSPEHDTCATSLEIEGSTTIAVSLDAVGSDYSATCSPAGVRDSVVSLRVDEPSDVSITARGINPDFAVAVRSDCEEQSSEQACRSAIRVSEEEAVSRVLLRASEPGEYAVLLFSSAPADLEIEVEYRELSQAPENETCGTAVELELNQPVFAELYGTTPDVESACGEGVGDLLYTFALAEPSDVRIVATTADRDSEPMLSLRTGRCAELAFEMKCVAQRGTELFARALPVGDYSLAVSATLETSVEVVVFTEAPRTAPPGEECADAPPLLPGVTTSVDLSTYSDDIALSCTTSGRDAVFSLEVEQPSDVFLKQRISLGDVGAVALLDSRCDSEHPRSCGAGDSPPLRAVAHNVPAGSYRVIAESVRGNPVQVLALTRQSGAPIVVVGSDDCEQVVDIPITGAFLTGNTTVASPDFTASCDVANGSASGAGDQLLRLTLEERSLVILDAAGSAFRTIINLRAGPECPGKEVLFGCSAADQRASYVEAILAAGVYYVQVDGLAGIGGQWMLDVFIQPEG